MNPMLHEFRVGQRVWLSSECEYGVVASKPGQVSSGIGAGAQPRYVVLLPGQRRVYAHPNDLEPAATGSGFVRLVAVDGRAV